jgi:hypothetical protein
MQIALGCHPFGKRLEGHRAEPNDGKEHDSYGQQYEEIPPYQKVGKSSH